MRGKTQPDYHAPDEAIDIAEQTAGTVVIADPSDNPGGGAPGDSTVILRRLIERGVKGAALAPIWVRATSPNMPRPGASGAFSCRASASIHQKPAL